MLLWAIDFIKKDASFYLNLIYFFIKYFKNTYDDYPTSKNVCF